MEAGSIVFANRPETVNTPTSQPYVCSHMRNVHATEGTPTQHPPSCPHVGVVVCMIAAYIVFVYRALFCVEVDSVVAFLRAREIDVGETESLCTLALLQHRADRLA